LVARVEKLCVVVYQKSDITNNTIGVNFARATLVERKGKFKVKWAYFVTKIKGMGARGHKGKVVAKSQGTKREALSYCNCTINIFNQLGITNCKNRRN
jgi:hypothetical protein